MNLKIHLEVIRNPVETFVRYARQANAG